MYFFCYSHLDLSQGVKKKYEKEANKHGQVDRLCKLAAMCLR